MGAQKGGLPGTAPPVPIRLFGYRTSNLETHRRTDDRLQREAEGQRDRSMKPSEELKNDCMASLDLFLNIKISIKYL